MTTTAVTPEELEVKRYPRGARAQSWIRCGDCGVAQYEHGNPDDKWNRRPIEDRLRAIVEAQKELIEAMETCDAIAGQRHFWKDEESFQVDLRNAIERICTAKARLEELER